VVLKGVLAAACGLAMAGCVGVYGPKGNDTGGIIPWSPANEAMAMQLAQENCGYYRKYAVIRTIHRVYGDWISYDCRFDPPGVPRGGRVVEDIVVEPRPVGAPPPRRAARGPATEPDIQIIR
jgi:hypothetical protein